LEEHYKILGLRPGAGPEDVKKAFRSRIKECHPDKASGPEEADRARRLIEAYGALKDAPPVTESAGSAGARPSSGPFTYQGPFAGRGSSAQSGASYRGRPGWTSRPRPEPSPEMRENIQRYARAAGRRLYEELYGQSPFSPHFRSPRDKKSGKLNMENVWEKLAEEIWGDGEEVQAYGDNVEVREFRREEPPPSQDQFEFSAPPGGNRSEAEVYFNRAESILRDIVRKYDSTESLKRKNWIREYLTNLTNVQVLFRDVANRHPSLYGPAINRVRQIGELSSELRRMMV